MAKKTTGVKLPKANRNVNQDAGLPDKIKFSIFSQGHVNKEGKAVMAVVPYATATLKAVYDYIRDPRWAGEATKQLRTISDHDANSEFKLLNFRVATFSVLVAYRNAQGVLGETPFLILDFDKEDFEKAFPGKDIKEMISWLRHQLREDRLLTVPLYFNSPNGDGAKAVVYVGDHQGLTHRECFEAISTYIYQRYHIMPDQSGSDATRPCYLPHDPTCHLVSDLSNILPSTLDLRLWHEEYKRITRPRVTMAKAYDGNADDVFQLVEQWVERRTVYVEGSRNIYVFRCACLLCEFGIAEEEVEQWAIDKFNDLSAHELSATIRSAYRHSQFNIKQFNK